MGSMDHVHLVVPDREAAARWYAERLGFEAVDEYAEWAAVDGGPLHISADGGKSGIALFQASSGHPAGKLEMGVAFRVDAETFIGFALGLAEIGLLQASGEPLEIGCIVDFDLCYAYNFEDPYGNQLELDCHDHATVKRELVEAQGLTPVRYW